MLTALDFPDELLYSREALWVRDGGAGSARVGLASYAALGDDTDVYFVKLPKAGARLVKGEAFGHVDLGRRTVPLVAPFGGSVLFANGDLRGEPGLLARDPFGRGYLLEVEGIDGEEMDALLEREDALFHFGRFDVPLDHRKRDEHGAPLPDLDAEQVYEEGRPWPSRLAFRFGGRAYAQARILPPLGNEVFVPDWMVGDAWTVECVREGKATRFAFEVLGDGRVAEDEVTRVRAVEVGLPGGPEARPRSFRILHFRVGDHTLAAWDEVDAGDPATFRRHYNPRGRECWLGASDPADGFILDHPKLPVSLDDEARDIPESADKTLFAVSHYVKFRGGLTRVEAEMRADLPREDGRGTERLFSSLVYDRGAPWWREATRTIGDTVMVRARLVGEWLRN